MYEQFAGLGLQGNNSRDYRKEWAEDVLDSLVGERVVVSVGDDGSLLRTAANDSTPRVAATLVAIGDEFGGIYPEWGIALDGSDTCIPFSLASREDSTEQFDKWALRAEAPYIGAPHKRVLMTARSTVGEFTIELWSPDAAEEIEQQAQRFNHLSRVARDLRSTGVTA